MKTKIILPLIEEDFPQTNNPILQRKARVAESIPRFKTR